MKLTAAGFVSVVLLQTNAWMVPPPAVCSSRRRRPSVTMLVDKNGENEKRTKVIAPGEIASLFGGGSSTGGSSGSTSRYEDDYSEDEYDYGEEDGDGDDVAPKSPAAEDASSSSPSSSTATTATAVPPVGAAQSAAAVDAPRTMAGRDADSETMRELVALEEMAFRPAADDTAAVVVAAAVVPVDDGPSAAQLAADAEDDGMGYMNLGRRLDSATRRSVADSMSMRDADIVDPMVASGGAAVPALRVVKYDPTEYARGDPMKYGAYRRWKLAETEDGKPRLDSKGNPLPGQPGAKPKTPSRGGYRQGDYKIEGQNSPGGGAGGRGRMLGGGGGSGLKKKGKKKGAEKDDPMSNFIRKFGSGTGNAGPTKDGGVGGTGFSEPPPDKKPIQPKKAPTKKNKKRVITPDDIYSLFPDRAKEQAAAKDDDDDDDDEDDEEDEEDEAEDGSEAVVGGNAASGAMTVAPFNPLMGEDEETPQWIVDADKEAKMQKKMRGKKKKRLTDDWRFWAACIVTAGFATAFWNVYQQTGGLGSGPGFSGFGGLPERQELII